MEKHLFSELEEQENYDNLNNRVIKREFPKEWITSFKPETITILSNAIRIGMNHNRLNIYPERENVFRIFRRLLPKHIKVVILGQDPYHNGNANGFAFGCNNDISPSLNIITKSILKNYKGEHNKKFKRDLEYLVEQGVFLCNTRLTVDQGTPMSHSGIGWEQFTREWILSLQTHQNIVWMLWGSEAKKFKKFITNKSHLVLEHTHPAYAAHTNTAWNCTHFQTCNNYLESKNQKSIKWLL